MNDFFERMGVGMIWPGPDRTKATDATEEWGVRVHGGVVIVSYDSHDAALRALEHHRTGLRKMNIPEEYWPILVSRTVETSVGSWRHNGE